MSQESVPLGFSEIDYRFSFHVGGFVKYVLKDRLFLQGELIFSSQGGFSDVEFTNNSGELTSTERPRFVYNYINIPVLFKYELVEGLNINSGPQVGFLLAADVEGYNRNFGANQVSVDSDMKSSLSPIDLSWSFGLGYQFNSALLIDAAYNLGLNNTNEGENDLKVKNSVFQLSLGYKF